MATKLDKDLVRESTIAIDGREILVTIAADQSIKMKLKGLKSGDVSIDIGTLFNQLSGRDIQEAQEDEVVEESNNRPMTIISHDEDDKPAKGAVLIDLNDLRAMNAISMLDVSTMCKFDGIIADLLKQKTEVQQATSLANRPVAGKPTKKKKK